MDSLTPVEVIFDSQNATSGSSNSPSFTMYPGITDVVGFSLKYVNVPFTYYVIDATSNQFKLTPNGGSTYTISIASGTYNAVNLISALNDAMANSSVPSLPSPGNYNFFVDNTDSKLKIYNASNAFTISFVGLSNPANDALGFSSTAVGYDSASGVLTDNTDTSLGTVNYVSGDRVVNLSGPNLMFLRSQKLGSLVFGTTRNQAGLQSLIGFWPVNSNYQGTISFFKDQPQIIPCTPTTITDVDLQLTIGNRTSYTVEGTTQNYLSLNGEGFQIAIVFWCQTATKQMNSQNSLGDRGLSAFSNHTSQIMKPYQKGIKRTQAMRGNSTRL